MADETDFLDLYRKLRLEPGCSLEDFKQAYRRNVAMWHPDRRRGSRADVLAAGRLQRLTAQYGAAMDFHRRHGRLPGAPLIVRQPEAVVETLPAESEDIEPAVAEAAQAAAPPRRAPPRGLARRWWLVIVLVGVAVAAWSMWPAGEEFEGEAEQDTVVPLRLGEHAVQGTLSLGMTQEEVLAVEGEPTHRGDDRWEYGPSWIRFEQGAVVDWYSSPLRSLRVSSSKPRP